jgi:FkbM family methyltransferase
MNQLVEPLANRWPLGLAQAAGIAAAVWNHPANSGRRLRSLARLFGWQFVKHVLKRAVTIRFHGRRLKCYPDSTSTSGAIYFSGYPDYWEMKFLQAYLRPGDGFLDIGANTGVYSILASAYVGHEGRIDAFEPLEATAGRIEEQSRLNGLQHLRVHRCAVADREGEIEFGYSRNDAMMHLRRHGERASDHSKVNAVTLDTFREYGEYAAGKMDIEGAEPLALAGAADRLRQANPPVWLLELAGYSTLYGISSDAIVSQLSAAGFRCAIFRPETGRIEYTDTPWVFGVQNVLAIARSHETFVDQRLRERDCVLP